MHLRPLVPMGLALIASSGCQSYFPYGYGNTNPYPSMSGPYSSPSVTTPSRTSPSGTSPSGASPSGSGQYPTPANGQTNLNNSGSNRGQPSRGRVPDPRYSSPGNPPTDLGTPATDDEQDSIRGGRSSLDKPPAHLGEAGEESDESLSSLDDQKFVSPTPFRPASATSDDVDMRRPAARSRPSPYKYDAAGYTYLRGVVSQDPTTKSWRITYSRDPLDRDPYGGSLTLVESKLLDTLMEDDVVLVEGQIDSSILDKYKKPCYRARTVLPLQPKEN